MKITAFTAISGGPLHHAPKRHHRREHGLHGNGHCAAPHPRVTFKEHFAILDNGNEMWTLEDMMRQFPFHILGFQSEGSEFLGVGSKTSPSWTCGTFLEVFEAYGAVRS